MEGKLLVWISHQNIFLLSVFRRYGWIEREKLAAVFVLSLKTPFHPHGYSNTAAFTRMGHPPLNFEWVHPPLNFDQITSKGVKCLPWGNRILSHCLPPQSCLPWSKFRGETHKQVAYGIINEELIYMSPFKVPSLHPWVTSEPLSWFLWWKPGPLSKQAFYKSEFRLLKGPIS